MIKESTMRVRRVLGRIRQARACLANWREDRQACLAMAAECRDERRRARFLAIAEKDARGIKAAAYFLSFMDKVLSELPPETLQAIRAHYMDGRPWKDVAAALGISHRRYERMEAAALEHVAAALPSKVRPPLGRQA